MSVLAWLRSRSRRSVDLGKPPAALDPFAAYGALRRGGPVRYMPRHDFWLVLSNDAVKEALDRPDLFSSAPYAPIDAVLLGADPPRHTAVRRVVGHHFSPLTMARVEAAAAEEAAARLAPELDVVADFSLAVSRAAAAELLGFDRATAAELGAAAEAAAGEPNPVEALVVAVTRFADRAALFPLLAQGSDRVEEAEARSLVRLLWLAATTTTERVITRAILCLLQQPELRAALLADRALVGPYIEEVMRLYPPELMLPRRATKATSLAGCTIPAGAEVRLCVAAANRDPAAYSDPDELRLTRSPNPHLAFGGGAHRCLGAGLGRRVAAAALTALLDQGGALRAAEPLERLDWFTSVTAISPIRLLVATD
jgi:cytochrome P450